VEEVVEFAVGRNPRLAKAALAIEAAMGKYTQAGLYPNPTVSVTADELGDRTGPGGIITAPQVSQEIVRGGKLALARAVAAREVDQATLASLGERYAVVGGVRTAFYDLYALERRLAALDEVVKLASDAVSTGKTLKENGQIARLDLVQLDVELERYRAKAEAARRELPGARNRLAAAAGDPRMAVGRAVGPYEDVPLFDADRTLEAVLATHPEVLSARVGADRAQAALRRAQADPVPNVTVSAGYTYQGQNKSNDWGVGVSMPIPLWNRNQGNIRAASAELGSAVQEIGRVENALAERVANLLRSYASAMKEAQQYKAEILPRAQETYSLSLEGFKGGQFEYLKVIQAQRAIAEARLEYNRALGEAWKAAAELSAMLLEERFPVAVPPAGIPATDATKPPAKKDAKKD
jgi:cobalt-zinc-cadmium efflux system outer membrane protein